MNTEKKRLIESLKVDMLKVKELSRKCKKQLKRGNLTSEEQNEFLKARELAQECKLRLANELLAQHISNKESLISRMDKYDETFAKAVSKDSLLKSRSMVLPEGVNSSPLSLKNEAGPRLSEQMHLDLSDDRIE
jgi:hypothetical protein